MLEPASVASIWITGAVVVAVMIGLVVGRVGADLIVLAGLSVLLMAGVLEPAEALAGFANPAVITVALLYVVAAGLRETGALEGLTARVLGRPRTAMQAQARVVIPVAIASAFVANTPIVAMLMPALSTWSRRTGRASSSLLMPLSFAAVLGGMCTLIGTSTNLVIDALLAEHAGLGVERMGMFSVAVAGLPAAIVGLVYLVVVAPWLLPHKHRVVDSQESARQYYAAMRVAAGSPAAGRTVETAGLRHLPGLYLVRIEREHETIVAVGPDQVLAADDVLVFVGAVESVADLRRIRGLEPVTDGDGTAEYGARERPELIEAVVAPGARFLGETVRDAEFRSRFGAAIVAVSRHGERISGKVGDIRLRAGDTLLLEAKPEFLARLRGWSDFYLASAVLGATVPRHRLAAIALAILVALILAVTWRPEQAMTFAMVAALSMVACRCCSSSEGRSAVDLQVLLVIAGSFGLASAIERSGLAVLVADRVIDWGAAFGFSGLLAMLFIVTAALTSLITNNAAAILVFPVALAAAHDHGYPMLPFAICIAVAASAGFSTAIGYQTNLMVMGPGGYRASDFARVGIPLTVLVGVACVASLSVLYAP